MDVTILKLAFEMKEYLNHQMLTIIQYIVKPFGAVRVCVKSRVTD